MRGACASSKIMNKSRSHVVSSVRKIAVAIMLYGCRVCVDPPDCPMSRITMFGCCPRVSVMAACRASTKPSFKVRGDWQGFNLEDAFAQGKGHNGQHTKLPTCLPTSFAFTTSADSGEGLGDFIPSGQARSVPPRQGAERPDETWCNSCPAAGCSGKL